ncbi:toxin-antitoxin system YwqK family antitoxin [Streptomyces sp. NPDC007904]|uniref:toxin-antitoxin system YwqK family antitoxin n=1 Tax=Streptomyces sp. NPDC007904 TaxID=3364787 RepID=UPI0036E049A3
MILAEVFRVSLEQTDVSAGSEWEERNWDAVVTCEYDPLQGDLNWSLSIYAANEVKHRPTEEELASSVAHHLSTAVFISWDTKFPWVRRAALPDGGFTLARVLQLDDDSPTYVIDAAESKIPDFPHVPIIQFPEATHTHEFPTPIANSAEETEFEEGDTRSCRSVHPSTMGSSRRIDIDEPDVDMDDAQRLLYRGEPFTGEVTEHLDGKLVSLDAYAEGVRNGLSREWYKDGTLRSEGTVRDGLPRGEFREWHPNGAPASRKVFADDGLTLREEHQWDEDGRPTRSWRLDDCL